MKNQKCAKSRAAAAPWQAAPPGVPLKNANNYQQLPLNDYLFHFAILIIIFNNNTQRT
ncbi:hypothetical protein J9S29_004087 [Salmonella enterica]|nr:hypothetical protein [Salmonella enterica]